MNSAPAEPWLLLDSGAGDSAFNMALDEALLELAPQIGRAVLRFYGWRQRAASFGYFQKVAEIERATQLRPLVRRPTGGGLVPHDADWTYSVVVPPNHSWYPLRAGESYERMHRWIQSALARANIETSLADAARKEIPGQCFVGHEKFDLLWSGKKIAGAAQRRTRDGLLIQGSIQPPPGPTRRDWQDAMRFSAEEAGWAHFAPLVPAGELLRRTAQLVAEKFSRDEHTRRR